MANEREVKLGLCSVSGKRCECESGGGCRGARVASESADLQELPKDATTFIKAALISLDVASAYLDEARKGSFYDRYEGGPEIRHAQARLRTIKRTLEELL